MAPLLAHAGQAKFLAALVLGALALGGAAGPGLAQGAGATPPPAAAVAPQASARSEAHAPLALASPFTLGAAALALATPGQLAPDFKLPQLMGGPDVHLAALKGKVVLLNLWATWCRPCREEVPLLIKLQRRHAARGLVVVGLSLDRGGPELVRRFVRTHGITYPVLLADPATSKAYGQNDALPTVFLIDRRGKVVDEYLGGLEEAEAATLLPPLLAAPP